MTKSSLFIALAFVAFSTAAEQTTSTRTQHISLTESAAEKAANEWGLTVEEWRRYERVMAGQRGIWSPGLDPITALGVDANTTHERDHYAELFVQAEFRRVEKELAFQRAVDSAWKRVFPSRKPIESRRAISGGNVERYGVVVSSSCDDSCSRRIKMLLADQERSPSIKAVDIYLLDSEGNDEALRAWVKKEGLPIEKIRQGVITINHGQQFSDIQLVPTVFAKSEGGQWERQ